METWQGLLGAEIHVKGNRCFGYFIPQAPQLTSQGMSLSATYELSPSETALLIMVVIAIVAAFVCCWTKRVRMDGPKSLRFRAIPSILRLVTSQDFMVVEPSVRGYPAPQSIQKPPTIRP